MRKDFQNILYHSRPVSNKRRPMSMHDRAGQFAPFAALTGFDAQIDETARLTQSPHELTEEELDNLNAALMQLSERENERLRVSVFFFKPDEYKDGGTYVTYIGNVKFVDEALMQLKFVDGNIIPIDKIVLINIEEQKRWLY